MRKQFKIIAAGLFFICISSSLFAQTGSLKGIVSDTAGNPVAMVTIGIQNSSLGTTTDEKGNFHLDNIPIGKQNVVAQLLGYKKINYQVQIKTNDTTEIKITLLPDEKVFGVVNITGIQNITGMGHLDEVHDGVIYSGKKNEVLILDSLDANTAQNNPRQTLGRIPGANYSETEGSGFPSNGIGFRGLNPTQSIELDTRQNGYNIAGDIYGYPESYYLPPLAAIERIEVTRGASSLQFGPQFGGVINYLSLIHI